MSEIYLVEEKMEMDDGERSWYSCTAYESGEQAFGAMQRIIGNEEPDILWKYSFERKKNGQEIQIIGKGKFLWDVVNGNDVLEPGKMTLTLMRVRFVPDPAKA